VFPKPDRPTDRRRVERIGLAEPAIAAQHVEGIGSDLDPVHGSAGGLAFAVAARAGGV
jgi:hypothetical protein